MSHHTYPVFDHLAPPGASVVADKVALQSDPQPSLLKLPPDILRATASYLNAADAVSLALSASGLQDAGECRAWKSLVLHARDPDLPASSRATFAIRLDTLIDRFRARKIRASYVESLAIIWPQWDEDHSEIQNGSLFPSTRKDSIASLADSSRTLLLGRLPTLPRCRSVRLEASHPDAAQILISLLHHTPALTDLRCKLKEGRKRPDYRLPALPLERPPLPHLRRLDLGMSTREYVDLLRLLLKEQSHTLDTLSVWAREQAGRDRIKEIREALLAADLSRTTVLGTFAGTWPPSASLPALEVAEVHMTVKASRPFLEEIADNIPAHERMQRVELLGARSCDLLISLGPGDQPILIPLSLADRLITNARLKEIHLSYRRQHTINIREMVHPSTADRLLHVRIFADYLEMTTSSHFVRYRDETLSMDILRGVYERSGELVDQVNGDRDASLSPEAWEWLDARVAEACELQMP